MRAFPLFGCVVAMLAVGLPSSLPADYDEAPDASDPPEVPALVHGFYRLSAHYETARRHLHPDVVEQHGLERLPSPAMARGLGRTGDVWDVTAFLQSKGFDLPDGAFARLDTGSLTLALTSTVDDHKRLGQFADTSDAGWPRTATFQFRIYQLDAGQHDDRRQHELIAAIDQEEPGILLVDTEQDTTPHGQLRWSHGRVAGDEAAGEYEAGPPAASEINVFLSTDFKAGEWTTGAQVNFDGWLHMDADSESPRRHLRWQVHTEGPAGEWQGTRATIHDVDLLLVHRTVLHLPAEPPPLLLSELFARPEPDEEPPAASGLEDSSEPEQHTMVHGYYYLGPPSIFREAPSYDWDFTTTVTENARNHIGMSMPPGSSALHDALNRVLFLHSAPEDHARMVRMIESEGRWLEEGALPLEVRAWLLEPGIDRALPARQLVAALQDGDEPGTRLLITDLAARFGKRTLIQLGIHPDDAGAEADDDPSDGPLEWLVFEVEPIWDLEPGVETVQVRFHVGAIVPAPGQSEPGVPGTEIIANGDLAGAVNQWLASRHRSNDLDLLIAMRVMVEQADEPE